ncbi:MAG: hypothetical protein EZS28_022180 [Streblomastix strix]|uniref:Uncharacterized protein n=1 Tax=Streblomastix strix TaxID=222440 RepID=A0A5J4VJ63_9EUKA|nr:MAG: hypothetical protein EZS28_022180 [Streblomastix strix]
MYVLGDIRDGDEFGEEEIDLISDNLDEDYYGWSYCYYLIDDYYCANECGKLGIYVDVGCEYTDQDGEQDDQLYVQDDY